MPRQTAAPRFLRLPEVREMMLLGTSTIYRWMSKGSFPKQIAIGANSVAWLESDVTQWMVDQMAAR